jgi:glucose-6-phosphate 1-dehydrogenase
LAPWRSGLRKLFPALYQLDGAGLLHEDTRIWPWPVSRARAAAPGVHRARTAPYVGKELDEAVAQRFLARLTYLHVDFLKPTTMWPWLKWPAARNA